MTTDHGEDVEWGRWGCVTHQDSTRIVCPCRHFDGRCHVCPDPDQRPPCFIDFGTEDDDD